MTSETAELVMHPVRLRILMCLEGEPQTTQQIADRLPDVPKSSLYRHLKLLLDGHFVTVAETRLVQGIQEKVYQLSRPARLGLDDMAGVSADDHLRYFTTYLMVLIGGFAGYLSDTPEPDMARDRVGYNEVTIWAAEDELDEFSRRLNEALIPLLKNQPDGRRHRHKIAVIAFPEKQEDLT